jgi:hypothetical protein
VFAHSVLTPAVNFATKAHCDRTVDGFGPCAQRIFRDCRCLHRKSGGASERHLPGLEELALHLPLAAKINTRCQFDQFRWKPPKPHLYFLSNSAQACVDRGQRSRRALSHVHRIAQQFVDQHSLFLHRPNTISFFIFVVATAKVTAFASLSCSKQYSFIRISSWWDLFW